MTELIEINLNNVDRLEKTNALIKLDIFSELEKKIGRQLDNFDKYFIVGLFNFYSKNYENAYDYIINNLDEFVIQLFCYNKGKKLYLISKLQNSQDINKITFNEYRDLYARYSEELSNLLKKVQMGFVKYHNITYYALSNMSPLEYYKTHINKKIMLWDNIKQRFDMNYKDIKNMLSVSEFVMFYNMCMYDTMKRHEERII